MHKQIALLALAIGTLRAQTGAPAPLNDDVIRTSATKAAKLMERSVGAFAPNIPCASCHHNNMPLWAFSVARDHGIPVNAELSRKVAIKTYGFLKDVDHAVQGSFFVDPSLEGGQLFAIAETAGVRPSVTTALHVRRLASLQREDGRWVTFDSRPPHSSSLLMTTAFSAKAIADFMPVQFAAERDARLAKARQWLVNAKPVSVEDHAFRLLGLMWTKASREEIQAAADLLLKEQSADGSWAQVVGRTADAYGTGEALAALKMTGTAPADAYARGAAWLVKNQLADGSWLVKTRLHEVAPISPPYMETGFPHGRNQIVSMVGTTWALMALSLGLPEKRQPQAELAELKPAVDGWMETAVLGSVEELKSLEVTLKTPAGSTVLMAVANDPAKVSALIARGANVHERSKIGLTAVAAAASYGQSTAVLRQLFDAGADAKPAKDVEWNATPLVMAGFGGDLETTKLLLDHGANATQTMMLQGMVPMNPVSQAVHLDEPAILAEYLKRGVSPNMVDEVPMLSLAAIANRPTVAKVLIDAGADLNFKDKFGWTPMRHARSIEHDVPMVEPLIQAALDKKNVSAIK